MGTAAKVLAIIGAVLLVGAGLCVLALNSMLAGGAGTPTTLAVGIALLVTAGVVVWALTADSRKKPR